MSYFLRQGNKFYITNRANVEVSDILPPANYSVHQDAMTKEYFLETSEPFKINHKIYGDTEKVSDRIMNTFSSRVDKNTGVLLTGEKGSGKTLLAKMLSIKCIQNNIPCVMIGNPYVGPGFNSFIESIDIPTMIFIDEFEKLYSKEKQENLLTLLDGTATKTKLFVLTCNDKYRIDNHMRNRPGRIFYSIDYKGLDSDFIKEYASDVLNNRKWVNNVIKIGGTFSEFNFDMLKALCEEVNRYNEPPEEAIRLLNAKPQFSDSVDYTVVIYFNGNPLQKDKVMSKTWRGNVLTDKIYVSFYIKRNLLSEKSNNDEVALVPLSEDDDDDVDEDDDKEKYMSLSLTTDKLAGIQPEKQQYTFIDGNFTVELTRYRAKEFGYSFTE